MREYEKSMTDRCQAENRKEGSMNGQDEGLQGAGKK